MFKFLKEKLKGFLGKEPKEEEKKKVEEPKKERKKQKPVKEKKQRTTKEKKKVEKKPEVEKEIEEIPEFEEKKEKAEKIEKVEGAIKEEEKPEIVEEEEEKLGFFSRLKQRFKTTTVSQEMYEEIFEKLEIILLENNVALDVVEKIKKDVEKDIVGLEIKKSDLEEQISDSLKNAISRILIDPFDLIEKIKEKQGTFVILFCGINGSGKTTTIAKISDLLNQNKISNIIAASDTFRAASIEQLEKHGEKLNVKIIKHNYGADPAAVAFDAIKHANSHKIKVVLIDTAGRMHTKTDLMREMEKISRISKPDLKIFVGESITGNDATEQAKTFNNAIQIDGIILSKADVDEKGGTTISVGHVTGKPILFLGMGQKYEDLEKFDKQKILESLELE